MSNCFQACICKSFRHRDFYCLVDNSFYRSKVVWNWNKRFWIILCFSYSVWMHSGNFFEMENIKGEITEEIIFQAYFWLTVYSLKKSFEDDPVFTPLTGASNFAYVSDEVRSFFKALLFQNDHNEIMMNLFILGHF